MLNINKTMENEKATLVLQGRVDTVTAPEFERAVKEIVPMISELVLDFQGVEYVSSAGLRVLLVAQKAIGGNGKMTLKNVNEAVKEILDVTGFSDFLTIE